MASPSRHHRRHLHSHPPSLLHRYPLGHLHLRERVWYLVPQAELSVPVCVQGEICLGVLDWRVTILQIWFGCSSGSRNDRLTTWQVSKQSLESFASSSQLISSNLSPVSFALSDMRKRHQPSRYHASTSWSSVAMIPCNTNKAGI